MYDVVVIGAGPSGLGVGSALKHHTDLSFIIVDSGKNLFSRSRYDAQDLVQGLGGAGPFSDGKYSFYPSSSALWNLDKKKFLRISYQWYRDELMKHHTKEKKTDDNSIPEYPDVKESFISTNEWFLKEYDSVYLSLEARYQFIDEICRDIGLDKFMLETTITVWKKVDDHYQVEIKDMITKKEQFICCKNIIVAGGRFWPYSFTSGVRMKFARLEYGVRIECSPEKSLFSGTLIKDPKYKYTTKLPVEYRTFCCCRNGEIVITNCNGIPSCSGRSDCEPTKLSNIGYNVRILDKTLSDPVKADLFNNRLVFRNVPMKDVINTNILTEYYGKQGNFYLVNGLKLLLERFPDFEDAKLSGPTIIQTIHKIRQTMVTIKLIHHIQRYRLQQLLIIFLFYCPNRLHILSQDSIFSLVIYRICII